MDIRNADEITWAKMAQAFGSSTRLPTGLILEVLGLWGNAVDGAKDKLFCSSYKICGT